MTQLFGYTGGTIVLLYFLALVLASILISIFAKGIWDPVKKDKGKNNENS